MSAGPGFMPPAQAGHRVSLQAVHGSGGGLPTRQRRPALVAVAVVLIAAGALGALQLMSSSDKTISVLVLARSVPAGHVIEAADLSSTRLSGKVAYWPASNESAVVGKTASRELVAGQLLTKSMMAATSVPDAEHALVGLSLKAGQLPSAGLSDGDTVELVDVPGSNTSGLAAVPTNPAQASAAPSSSAGSSSLVLATGTVYAIGSGSSSSSAVLVTVLVPRHGSEALSVAASNGQVALLRVGS